MGEVESLLGLGGQPPSVTASFEGIKVKESVDYLILLFVVINALIQGIIYLSVVPPWQHYDEPSHFEFAWLLANHEAPLNINTFDPDMRRELAASMIEYDFFSNLETEPNLLSSEGEIWIGISQVNHRSLYYLLAGAPLRLIKTSDVTFQLYVVRSVSLLLFLLTIFQRGV